MGRKSSRFRLVARLVAGLFLLLAWSAAWACLPPMANPAMAFADGGVSGPCEGATRSVCLVQCQEEDRALESKGFPQAVLPASGLSRASLPLPSSGPRSRLLILAGVATGPPLHILCCRLLN